MKPFVSMGRTESTMMLQVGAQAPEFSLPDAAGQLVSRSDYVGKVLLVMFICNHCPFVRHIQRGMVQLALDYAPRGVGIVGINSNDADAYPEDSPQAMLEEAGKAGYTFAYLVDASQKVAAAYRAACTPDFFVFDAAHKLSYRGQFDGARPTNEEPVTGRDLRTALDRALGRREPVAEQVPSLGCNIKWRPEMAPAYTSRS